MTERHKMVWAVFFAGFAVLLFELALTRIFSVLMWYHFASLSIALALFGLAVGGAIVHLRPALIPEDNFPRALFPYLGLFCVSACVPFFLLGMARAKPGILFPLLSFFHQPYFQPFRQVSAGPDGIVLASLGLLYVVITVPFAAAGVFFAGLFLRSPSGEVGRLYGADLVGAAAGCLLLVPGLSLLGAPSILLIAAASAGIGACALVRGFKRYLVICLVFAIGTIAVVNGPGDRLVGLEFARGQYESKIQFSRWNAISRVVVYPLNKWEAEQSWGLSRRFTGPVPGHMAMLVDDAGYTPIVENAPGTGTPQWAQYHIVSLPYMLRPGSVSLIIGPGGGRDILAALGNGARSVTAVELNPLIVEAVQERFHEFSGRPYSLPGVTTIVGEGRSELAAGTATYDIIQASSVFGEISPSAGAFSLSANFLYTREAFNEYWEHLAQDGILSFSRTIFGKRALRLITLARDTVLEKKLASPAESIAVIRERGLATLLVARNGFTPGEVKKLAEIARSRSFRIEALPGIKTGSVFERAIAGEDVTGGRFDISSPTDDKPFFYNNVPSSRFFNVFFKPRETGERHVVMLRTMGIIMVLLVLILLFLPLFGGSRIMDHSSLADIGKAAAYFGAMGAGYILFELTIMHKLSLFLKNPTYSLSVVLFVLLLSSGAGSLCSGKFDQILRGRYYLLTVALILLFILSWAAAGILKPSLDIPLAARVLLAGMVIAPPGFVMGIFMPVGLTALKESGSFMVPWAWAINGSAAVTGALGSLIIAMNFGYTKAFTAGVVLYLLTVPFLRSVSKGTWGMDKGARKEEI